METRNTLKRSKDPPVTSSWESSSAKESDKNDDDSIHESDGLSDLRFSSQDNLLNSSQDGDNQCMVKWDYTSPQTVRQLRKMKGKYSVDDVKAVIAKFPDLPVTETEPTFRNIRLMLPPKDAALNIERNKQLKAKQRELKKMQRRQRSREVARDMILFLQQEQHKQENKAAENLERTLECTDKNLTSHPETPSNNEDLQSLEEKDDFWSDDDLFRDNSFLIEATQNPDKFLNAEYKVASLLPKSNLEAGKSSVELISKLNPPSEMSVTKTISKPTVISTSNTNVSSYAVRGKNLKKPTGLSKGSQSISNSNSVNKISYGISKNQTNTNVQKMSHISLRSQLSESKCDKKTISKPVSCFNTTKKIQTQSLKSPLRKSLSFDASQIHKFGSKQESKNSVSNIFQVKNLKDQKQSSEMDLFDSSLSDDLLLQATLSQEMASKCLQSTSTSYSDGHHVQNTTTGHSDSMKLLSTKPNARITKANVHVKTNASVGSITDLLLSPVKHQMDIPGQQSKGASKSSTISSNRNGHVNKSAVPLHMSIKHKSSPGLSSSTPVKCSRTETGENKSKSGECSDSFLERAFEDSFMNDEALFESQILPMLEMAESQVQEAPHKKKVTPVPSTNTNNQSCSPIKCSQEEIEVKRQKALQKRSLRLAQMNHRKS